MQGGNDLNCMACKVKMITIRQIGFDALMNRPSPEGPNIARPSARQALSAHPASGDGVTRMCDNDHPVSVTGQVAVQIAGVYGRCLACLRVMH